MLSWVFCRYDTHPLYLMSLADPGYLSKLASYAGSDLHKR